MPLFHFREEAAAPPPPNKEEKFIVFESCLTELFRQCPLCRAKCSVVKVSSRSLGSMAVIKQNCLNKLCMFKRSWESQPKIGKIPAGNLLLSSATLYAGASPTQVIRVLKNLNIKTISGRTFLNHQKHYLQPTIIDHWKKCQEEHFEELRNRGEALVLGGDGRADSPGHSAKYGVYTLMDLKTFKVVDVQLVQVNMEFCEDVVCLNMM